MRIYAIKYKLYHSNSGGFKYALNPSFEYKTELYLKNERDKFIERYQKLMKGSDFYYGDIKCFVGELEEIDDMDSVINAV